MNIVTFLKNTFSLNTETKEALMKKFLIVGLGNIGGFTGGFYWSSSEDGNFNAWKEGFDYGSQFNHTKAEFTYVRAVRAF